MSTGAVALDNLEEVAAEDEKSHLGDPSDDSDQGESQKSSLNDELKQQPIENNSNRLLEEDEDDEDLFENPVSGLKAPLSSVSEVTLHELTSTAAEGSR